MRGYAGGEPIKTLCGKAWVRSSGAAPLRCLSDDPLGTCDLI